MIRYGFILIFVLWFVSGTTAQIAVVSPDNKTFAISYRTDKKKGTIRDGVNVYDMNTRKLLKNFELDNRECSGVTQMIFANNQKTLFLYSHCSSINGQVEQYSMFDIEKAKKVEDFQISQSHQILFSHKGDFFVAHLKGSDFVEMFASSNRQQLGFFSFKKEELVTYKSWKISQKDDFLALINPTGKVLILKKNDVKFRKDFNAVNAEFVNQGNDLLLYYETGETELLSLADFKSKLKNSALAEFKSSFSKSQTNEKGTYTALSTDNGFAILDNSTLSLSFKTTVEGMKTLSWKDDNTVVVDKDLSGISFDIATKKQVSESNYQLNTKEFTADDNEQISKRNVSSNRRYVALNISKGNKDYFCFKPTIAGAKQLNFPNYQFIAFSSDSKYLFLQNDQKDLMMVVLADLEKLQRWEDFRFEPLLNPNTMDEEEKKQYQRLEKEAAERETLKAKNQAKTEDKIDKDFVPKNYTYHKTDKPEHISKADQKTLKIVLRNVIADKDATCINVHLLDDKGNYYYGAGEDKALWKNLIVKQPDGTNKDIKDFEVIEHNSTDTLATAVVLALDMSGSMGDARALMIEEGAEQVIKHKRKQDAIAVLKYDSFVGVEAKLNKNSNELSQQLKKNGLEGYGLQTALFDAVDQGRYLLRNATGYNKKSVFLFTDGNENASKIAKNEVILNAIKRGINIYTIGFGYNVSAANLQSIAYSTGGAYYHIYDSEQLRWILQDVYTKSLCYYTIKFKNEKQGKHVARIDVFLKNKFQDTLMVAYDNTPQKLDTINVKKDNGFGISVADLETTKPRMERFQKPEKMEEQTSELVSSTRSNLKYRINQDFSNFDFPNVEFVTNTADIVSGTEKGIEQIIGFMKVYPNSIINLEGHTDNSGTPEFNQKLSQLRAETIKNLIVKGNKIAPERIKTIGYGATKPISTNDTEEGKARNRRVVFKLVKF